jgi:hypothetical protein
MFKGFFIGFIVLVLVIAILLYSYGSKTISNMTTPQTQAFVDSTTDAPGRKKWADYAPPSKKFNAKFPTLPQHATDRSLDSKTKELKQYEMYISESNGQVFMISVISFLNTDNVKDEENLIKRIVDDMVSSNPGNKLEKIQFGTHEGRKSADFVIVNSTYAILGKAFVNANQLYVISVLGKTPEDVKKDFDNFVASFKLNNTEPSNLVPSTTPKEK